MSCTYELIGGNGDHLLFDNENYMLMKDGFSGWSTHPVDLMTNAAPGQIGETLLDAVIGKREFSFNAAIIGTSREELEEKRQRLVSALNPLNKTLCTLIWNRSDGSKKCIRCITDAGSPEFQIGTSPAPGVTVWECTVDMVAADPCWYETEPTIFDLTAFVGGFKLPFSYPFTLGSTADVGFDNPGDTETPCKLTLYGKLTAPIVITNYTTGETITINIDVDTGYSLEINTAYGNRRVLLIDPSGTPQNALFFTSIDSQFFQIPPGRVRINYSAYEEGDTAHAVLEYTPRWLSI